MIFLVWPEKMHENSAKWIRPLISVKLGGVVRGFSTNFSTRVLKSLQMRNN